MKKLALYTMMLALLCTGCMKEELPVPKAPRGDAATHQLCMGAGYAQQLWFDLGAGAVVAQNDRAAWDLALESAPDGWRVMLNGSRLMTAWDLGAVDISAAHDTAGMAAGRRIDAPSGQRDSTAIGDWRGTGHVYLIDMGYDALGLHMGYVKLRMSQVSSTHYTLDFAQLDGSALSSLIVTKDPVCQFTYLSLEDGILPIEPQTGSWDFCFSQYTHQFYEPYMPYLVNGVLTPTGVRAARIDGLDFNAIALSDTLAFPMEGRRNTIGYDWKYYSFETGSYTVVTDRAYIVQDAEGYFYKLRFIDFYGDSGQSGCPKFEVVPL